MNGPAVVVQLVLVRPAHPARALARRWPRLTCGRPRSFLRSRVRCGARMTQPLWPVQRSTSSAGVVRRQVGVAGVAEDALHEVEVRDQAARREEADLHAASPASTLGTAGQTSGRSSSETIVSTGSGQSAVNGRRSSSAGGRSASCSSRSVGGERHRDLVRRDRQPALGDVEDALGGAAVAHRVVQHAVVEAVARDQLVVPRVAVDRQRQLAREAVAVEDQGLRRAGATGSGSADGARAARRCSAGSGGRRGRGARRAGGSARGSGRTDRPPGGARPRRPCSAGIWTPIAASLSRIELTAACRSGSQTVPSGLSPTVRSSSMPASERVDSSPRFQRLSRTDARQPAGVRGTRGPAVLGA